MGRWSPLKKPININKTISQSGLHLEYYQ